MTILPLYRLLGQIGLLTTIFVAGLISSTQAQTVYSQPTDYPHGSVYLSENTPRQFSNATTFDNFTLAQDTLISSATWQGQYFFGNPGGITGFTLAFSSSTANNQPGAVIETETLLGNGNESAVDLAHEVFNYSDTFATPFIAKANTTYWFSIVANIDPQPAWYWHTGTGGDGTAVQISNSQGFPSPSNLSHDMAFSLLGTPVPEASTSSFGILLLLGLGAFIVYKCKRSA